MRLLLKIALLVAAITAAVWGVAEVLARVYLQRALSEGWSVPSGRLEAIQEIPTQGDLAKGLNGAQA